MSQDLGTIFYSVDAKADGLLTTSKAVDKQIATTEKGLASVEKSALKLNRGFGKLADGQADLAKATDQAVGPLGEIVQTLLDGAQSSGALNQQLSLLARAIQAVIAASALRQIAEMVQGYEEMADRVRLATSGTEEYEMVQRRLLATANGTYRALSEAQELYIRTADSLRAMGYSTEQALDVTDSLAYAFVTNATSADKASSATDALSKVLAKGKVEADAWESVIAATPSVINAVAEASGKTAQEVRALGAAGKLSAADLTEGLRRSLDANARAAAEMSNNLRDAGVRTETALTAVFVSIENQTGAWQKLTDGIIMAADWMLSIAGDSEKMATILNLATGAASSLAAIIAGRLITAFLGYANAQLSALQANLASIGAAQAAARANVTLAESAYSAATAALAQQRAIIAAGGSMLGTAADANNLAIAEARLQAATQGLTAAQAALATTATRTGLALAGLRTAMGFLGGPAGVVLLAAAAIYTFTSNTKAAKTEVDALNGSLEKLTFSQLGRASNEVKDEIAGINKEYSALLSEFNTMTPRGWVGETKDSESFIARQTEVRAKLDDVNQALAARQARLADIAKAQENLANPPKAANPTVSPVTAPDPDAAARIQALKDEEALLKVVGEARAKLKAIQQLGDNATPEQIKEAEALAASIYKLEQAETKQKEAKKKGASEAEKATKKANAEQKKGIEENIQQFQNLGVELANVSKSARQVAMDQAELSLNEYATPEQVEQIRAIAAALYDAKAGQAALAAADPIAGEQIRYSEQLKQLQDLNTQKLLSDQRYLELKGQAERAHLEEMRALQEANFRAASMGNELLMSSIDALAASGTQALSGLLSGTSNLQDAMAGIANTVLNSVIGAFVQMAADWVKQQVIMAVAGQATATAATAVAVGQAGIIGAAWAGPAALASLATLGGNAAPAAAAITATTAIAATAGLTGGLKNGGPVSPGGLYRVNEGGAPEIFTGGNGQQYLMPNKRGEVVSNADATGGGGAQAPIVNVNNYSGQSSSASSKWSEADKRFIIDVIVGDMQSNGKSGQTANQITGTRRVGR